MCSLHGFCLSVFFPLLGQSCSSALQCLALRLAGPVWETAGSGYSEPLTLSSAAGFRGQRGQGAR